MKRKWWPAALLGACLLMGGPAAGDGPSDAGTAFEAAKRGDYARAVRYYTRALWSGELSPTEIAAAHYNRALVYLNLADYPKAIEDYSQAIEISPDYAAAYYNRAVTHAAGGDYPAAVADYTNAIWLGYSDSHKAFFNRGTIYEGQGDFERAVADFKEAYTLAPEEPRIRDKAETLGLER